MSDDPGQTHHYGDDCGPPHEPVDDTRQRAVDSDGAPVAVDQPALLRVGGSAALRTTRTTYPTSICQGCRAPILWAITDNGERIPLDPQPCPGGNIRLRDERVAGHHRASVVGATIDMFDRSDDGERWISHFATCEFADEFRTKR